MKFKCLLVLPLIFSLTACGINFIPAVQQGNILPESAVQQIHLGMTEQQVLSTLGSPILNQTYDNGQIMYSYSFKPGHGSTKVRNIVITMNNKRVSKIEISP